MRRISVIGFAALLAVLTATRAQAAPPRVFLLDGKQLEASRQRLRDGDAALAPALQRLERDARKSMELGPFSVMRKDRTAPSGDKHDYMSQAPYWWADPAKPEGLPYIRKDGQRNPEINKITDATSMKKMSATAEQLALAYYFSGDETYATRAAELLRAWFIDPATRMNPNLRYAQAIPGINDGRGIGIIETVCLTNVVDAIGLLAGSKSWTEADGAAMQDWFKQYLTWLIESPNGKDESAAKNNHGTHYDLQAVTFALFVRDDATAKRILDEVPTKRIAVQIEPDGGQPLELERTKAWSYSVMNVRGLMQLAVLGKHAGIDLWNAQTSDGRSIRKALDYLVPFATGEQKWPHEQLNGFRPEGGSILLRRAALAYPDANYAAVVKKLPPLSADTLDHLTGPRLVGNEQDSR
jgi:hypothetical protein